MPVLRNAKSVAAAVKGLFVASPSSPDARTHSGRPRRHLRCCAAHHPTSTIGCRRSLEDLRAPELLSATAKTLSNLRLTKSPRAALKTLRDLWTPELLSAAVKTLGNLRSPELLGASVIPLGRIPGDLRAIELLRPRMLCLSRSVADLGPAGYLPRPFSSTPGMTCRRRAASPTGPLGVYLAGSCLVPSSLIGSA